MHATFYHHESFPLRTRQVDASAKAIKMAGPKGKSKYLRKMNMVRIYLFYEKVNLSRGLSG